MTTTSIASSGSGSTSPAVGDTAEPPNHPSATAAAAAASSPAPSHSGSAADATRAGATAASGGGSGHTTTPGATPAKAPAAFTVDRAQFKRGKGTNGAMRICILEIARGFTLEVTRASDLAPADQAKVGAAAAGAVEQWPHDTEEAIRALEPTIEVEKLYLTPDPRKAVGAIRRRVAHVDIFVNQYDLSDATGQAITEYMDRNGVAFTGGGARFYDPPREELKKLCRYYGIDTPNYCFLTDTKGLDVAGVVAELGGFPLFVKPEHGYDSVGIDTNSVVTDLPAFAARVQKVCDEFGSALVEKFVDGREFSVLVAGAKGRVQTFPAVEYEFPAERRAKKAGAAAAAAATTTPTAGAAAAATTPANGASSPTAALEHKNGAAAGAQPNASDSGVPASFITFQDKWGSSYSCHWVPLAAAEAKLGAALEAVAKKLFEAFEGEGVARMDIRRCDATGKLMVLDINPNPSLFYRDECTADTLLRYCGWSKADFLAVLLDHGLARAAEWTRLHANTVPKYTAGKGFSLQAARALAADQLVYSDEMNPLRLVTREYVLQRWPRDELNTFQAYCWPVGENTYAIWDVDPKHWKPINHSCDPNCWMTGLEVRARRPIAKGEELTLDYATFLPHHPPFECWCGAAVCRRKMKPAEYREPGFEATYRGHYTPYIHSQRAIEQQIFDVVKTVLSGQTNAAIAAGTVLPTAAAGSAPHSPPTSGSGSPTTPARTADGKEHKSSAAASLARSATPTPISLPSSTAASASVASSVSSLPAANGTDSGSGSGVQQYSVAVSDEQIRALIAAISNAKVEQQFQEIRVRTTQLTEGVTSVHTVPVVDAAAAAATAATDKLPVAAADPLPRADIVESK